MTRDELTAVLTPVARHGLTALGAVLAAKGLTGAADATPLIGMGLLTAFGSLAWAFLEKSHLLAGLVEDLPRSDVEQLIDTVARLRAEGASPLLVAHMAQALATVAVSEVQGLVPQPVVDEQAARQIVADARLAQPEAPAMPVFAPEAAA